MALYESALEQARRGVILELGTFCGKSTVYLAAGVEPSGGLVVTVDHHRGSEEHQVGEEYHDPSLLDADLTRIETLPYFRRGVRPVVALDSARRISRVPRSLCRSRTLARPAPHL
ncbi:class I SAM-dependent methyltransferase [Streptomyces sp. S186]|uniref:class I SAM-dependent methyltransferase n=1 Tax=Streptomyces sp. S186 TaxID=3434395 RepID=UPI003F67B545